jgi:signal peptidase I
MTAKVKRRSPLGAALLSLQCVGLGQVYAGRLRRGLIWMGLAAVVVFGSLVNLVPVYQLLWLGIGFPLVVAVVGFALLFRIAAIVDAYWVARQAGTMTLRRYQRWYVYVGILFSFLIIFLIVDEIQPDRIPAYSIPSGSMVPTLRVGDYAVGANYGDRAPERGDIAIYFLPEAGVIYLKRIVGLPGDRIEMRGGRLYLNDTMVLREVVEGIALPDAPPDMQFYRETLPGGASYLIAETSDSGPLDDTEPFTVPPGDYFMLGDNRDNSRDSRVTGPISREQMRSKLFFLFWSRDRSRIGLKLE